MKTKLMPVLLLGMLMVSLMGSFVLAADDVLDVDAGVAPDSALYVLDTLADDVNLALTFNDADKAELAVEIAEERLAETEVMIEIGDADAADEAQVEHDESIADAEKALEEIDSDGSVENSEEAVAEIESVRERVRNHAEKVEAVKNRIMEKKRATMNAEQIAHMEAVFGKIVAKAQGMESKVDQKKENAKVKYKALSGLTDEEIEGKFAEIENKVKSERAEKVKTKTETMNAGEDSELQEQTETQTGQDSDGEVDSDAETSEAGNGKKSK